MGLSAASDCTLPLVSLLKTRRTGCWNPRTGVWEGRLSSYHSSVPFVFMCTQYFVCGSVDTFVHVSEQKQTADKHNKGKRKLDSSKTTIGKAQKSQKVSVIFVAAVITRHTFLLFHARMHLGVLVCLRLQLQFSSPRKMYKRTRTQSSTKKEVPLCPERKLFQCVLTRNLFTTTVLCK